MKIISDSATSHAGSAHMRVWQRGFEKEKAELDRKK